MTEPASKFEIQHLRRQILELKAQQAVRPVIPPGKSAYPVPQLGQIIGGQLINSVIPVIEYAADPLTVPSAYDPNVATSYVAGIGNGWIYNILGQPSNRILIRHNWAGFTDPLAAGDVFQLGYPINVSVAGGGIVVAYPIIGMA